ncbi:hypothetical protein HPB51_012794 [Rhipicephalus microplus]|uniref:Uncharacterized protein n=1 Tax=Rhipicephalus microplus TaxID=6941 RepID=A0A9J6D9X9_RHIMP|nr:hypothetical protein HPB51_012794 [Rhipicephalus microplus]
MAVTRGRQKWLSVISTFANILPCLTNIEILELMTSRLDLVYNLEPVCALFQVSSSLRGLHIRDMITNEQTVDELLNAILRKPTLEELSFEDLALETDPYIQTWKQYLSSTTMLKNLSLGTSNWSLQIAVLEGVLENKSIEKLSLFIFKATEESMALVTRIIKEKYAMRSLSIVTSDDELF